MKIRCIDFETTGEPEPEEIVELGWVDVRCEDGESPIFAGEGRTFVDPAGHVIDPRARGVHHITDAELAGSPSRQEAIKRMCTEGGIPDVFCAHEARFERKLWSTGKRPWLCTRKAALRLFPDAPDHKLQTLRYWLALPCDAERAAPVHRALPDAYVGANLLIYLLGTLTSVAQMIEWTEVPSLLPVCTLKKHKGKSWAQVAVEDEGYLRWMLDQADMDEDLRFTAEHHLKARAA